MSQASRQILIESWTILIIYYIYYYSQIQYEVKIILKEDFGFL